MMIDDLMDMMVKEVLDEFCLVYFPECGYNYGVTKWEDAKKIFNEFDLYEEYCFSADELIPPDYGFFEGEDILDIDCLRELMDKLGIRKNNHVLNVIAKDIIWIIMI